MLNILRKRAQSLVIQVIVLLIAVVFIFWGVGSNLNNNRNAAATVNDVEIPFQEFQQSYERAADNYSAQFGGQLPEGFLDSIGLKGQIINQLIQAELLRQGAGRIGLVASKEETQRQILEIAAFKKDGQFNEEQYRTVLSQNRLNPTSFEAGLSSDLITGKMVGLISSFAAVSDDEVQAWIDYGDTEVKFKYLEFSSSAFKESIEITEDNLSAWYEKNQKEYVTEPKVKIEFLYFPFADDLDQVQFDEARVAEFYSENINRYSLAEERHARHILFKVSPEDNGEIRVGKKERAENVLQMLQNGGDFAALAAEYSEGPTKVAGGDLGFFAKGMMVPAFDEVVFSMQVGELSGIVETEFGYHLIRLEAIKPAQIKSLEEVQAGIEKELKETGVKSITFQNASNAYEAIIRAGSLKKYIEAGGKVEQTDFFQKSTPPSSLKDAGQLLDVVFGLSKGELSSLVETTRGYAIAYVGDILQPEVPELSEVREQVVADYIAELSSEKAKIAAEVALAQAKQEESLGNDSAVETEYVKRGQSLEKIPQEIIQAAFTVNGKSVFPEEIVPVGDSFYVFEITDVRIGASTIKDEQKKALAEQLKVGEEQRLIGYLVSRMREGSKIWINDQINL